MQEVHWLDASLFFCFFIFFFISGHLKLNTIPISALFLCFSERAHQSDEAERPNPETSTDLVSSPPESGQTQ